MSGELRIRVDGADRIIHHFERATAEFRDMRPLMERMRKQLYEDNLSIFDQGQLDWPDWSPAYAKRRLYGMALGGPAGEMLGLTGRLQESLMGPTPENIAIINRRSITFGTKVPYASYVNDGVNPVRGVYGHPRTSSWDGPLGAGLPKDERREPFVLARNFTNGYTEAMKARWRRITENYSAGLLK